MVSKNKLFLFGFLFLLILFPLVNAQPPPQVNVNTDIGYDIDFPKLESLKINEAHRFNFHVFNRSDGLRLDNLNVDCIFHLFNSTGDHIVNNMDIPFEVEGMDWEIDIIAGNFSQIELQSVLVNCNSTGFGGFADFSFEVTETGFMLDTPQSLMVLVLILILLFLSGSFLFFGEKVEKTSVKIFLIALGVLFFLLTLGVSINAITQLMLVGSVFSGTFVSLYRLFLVLVSGGMIAIILYLITVSVKAFKKSRGILDDGD